MEITSDLFASVRVTGDIGAHLLCDVFTSEEDADGELPCDVEVDDSGHVAAMTANETIAGLEIEVGGTTFTLQDLIDDVEVSRTLGASIQSFRFTVPLDTPNGPIGNPFDHVGPATCKREVSIFGVYKTPTGTKRIPLITRGTGLSSKRRGGKGGFKETFESLDRGGRLDQQLVNISVPAGSGLPRERVLELAARRAGVTNFQLEPCGPTNKEFVLANSRWVEPCADGLMDVELRKVNWNRDGELANPRFGAPSLHDNVEPVKHHFLERDFHLETDVEIDWSADQITRAKLTGTAPILRDSCAVEMVPKRLETKAIYAPRVPGFLQNGDGSFTALDQDLAGADPILTKLDVIERFTKCGTVIYERTLHLAYYNPEAGRYFWDTATHEWKPIAAVYADLDELGEERAFQDAKEAFRLVGVEEAFHYWLQVGYRYFERAWPFGITAGDLSAEISKLSFPATDQLEYDVNSTGYFIGESAGIKLGTIRRTWGFYAPKSFVKTRSLASFPYPDWNTTESPDNLLVLGNKVGYSTNPTFAGPYAALDYPAQTFAEDGETFTLLSAVVETLTSNRENFVTAIDRTLFSWQAREGKDYLFGDGTERSEPEETFGISGTESELLLPVGDANHDRIVHRYDRDGRELPAQSELGAEGYLPAAEFIDGSQADPGLYADNAEQQALARLAHRTESQDLEVEVIASNLEDCRDVNQYVGVYEHAESDDELERAARAMISESCAAHFSGVLAGANFYVSEGDLFGFRYYPLCGMPERIGRVETVKWGRSSPFAPLLTTLLGKHYGW